MLLKRNNNNNNNLKHKSAARLFEHQDITENTKNA